MYNNPNVFSQEKDAGDSFKSMLHIIKSSVSFHIIYCPIIVTIWIPRSGIMHAVKLLSKCHKKRFFATEITVHLLGRCSWRIKLHDDFGNYYGKILRRRCAQLYRTWRLCLSLGVCDLITTHLGIQVPVLRRWQDPGTVCACLGYCNCVWVWLPPGSE